MRRVFAFAVLVAVAACGGSTNPTPVVPSPTPPAPTPTPVPTPTPNPYAAACGTPLPPMEHAYGFGIRVQLEPTRNKKVLNSSPVIRDWDYCAAAGFPGTQICQTRQETHPERVPCDHYLAGISDEGVPGPNWFEDRGRQGMVKCGEPGTNCRLKPENQYLLDIFATGRYVACAGEGTSETCGDCIILTMERATGSIGGLCKHE